MGCHSFLRQPAPPAPPQVVPDSPVDSRSNGWGANAKAVEVVIDADVPVKVEAALLERILMCTTTPCITKFPPGAYTLSASTPSPSGSRGCSVDVQISAVPTIVRLSLPPPETYAYCGVTLWAPEDKKIYSGSIR